MDATPIDDANLDPTAPARGEAYTDYSDGTGICVEPHQGPFFDHITVALGDKSADLEVPTASMLWEALGNAIQYVSGEPPGRIAAPPLNETAESDLT